MDSMQLLQRYRAGDEGAVEAFSGVAALSDDQTLVAVKINGIEQ